MQANGFSPVWRRTCAFRCELLPYALPQPGYEQACSRSTATAAAATESSNKTADPTEPTDELLDTRCFVTPPAAAAAAERFRRTGRCPSASIPSSADFRSASGEQRRRRRRATENEYGSSTTDDIDADDVDDVPVEPLPVVDGDDERRSAVENDGEKGRPEMAAVADDVTAVDVPSVVDGRLGTSTPRMTAVDGRPSRLLGDEMMLLPSD